MTLIILTFILTGCGRDNVKVYRIAKDQDQPQTQTAPALPTDSPNPSLPPGHPDISSAPAGMAAAVSGAPKLTWTTPSGWTEVAPGEMRVASFKITGQNGKTADVSVIPLPGLAGSDDANVNRWRGQVGLSPLSADDLKKSSEAVVAGDQPASLFDINGQNPGNGEAARILGVIQHRDDQAWFFKMTGDSDLAEQQKPAFIGFLKSVKFGAAPAAAEMPTTMAMPATPAPVSPAGKPDWQVPAGWQETSAGQFLVAKFNIAGPTGATAAVNVSSSAGQGGGLASNVNRWRGQLGLSPLSDADLNQAVTPLDLTGGKAAQVDISGTDARNGKLTRLVGIMVTQPDQTWFYKLMGDPAVVGDQKSAFTTFVQSVKY